MHKTIEILEKYCDRVDKELGELYTKISKSETLPPVDLESMDKLLHSLKSIKTVMAMLEYDERGDEGYSGKYYSDPVYTKRYSNDGGYSGNRYNRSMSRGYSRDSERSDMIRKLEDMMGRVRSEDEAMAIRDALDVVNRMS